jgi:LPXTG-motif cell wall-anchored protein
MTPARLAAAAVLAATALCLTPTPAHAEAAPKPQGLCATVGAVTTIVTRHGEQRYRCEQRTGEKCPRWRWIWNAGVPKGEGTTRPGPPCAECSTPPVVVVPAAVVPPQPVVRPVRAAAQLPVTGVPVPWLVAVGLLLAAAGAGLVRLGRRA